MAPPFLPVQGGEGTRPHMPPGPGATWPGCPHSGRVSSGSRYLSSGLLLARESVTPRACQGLLVFP